MVGTRNETAEIVMERFQIEAISKDPQFTTNFEKLIEVLNRGVSIGGVESAQVLVWIEP